LSVDVRIDAPSNLGSWKCHGNSQTRREWRPNWEKLCCVIQSRFYPQGDRRMVHLVQQWHMTYLIYVRIKNILWKIDTRCDFQCQTILKWGNVAMSVWEIFESQATNAVAFADLFENLFYWTAMRFANESVKFIDALLKFHLYHVNFSMNCIK
jgi:hypothetical protein